ncbi:MAG TPA: hypothetical protein VL049_19280 [Candidatus Dormibacteraeota bacterium]|nr:hypothetical protein [Candidatus Dormibacteraeota bacterium]
MLSRSPARAFFLVGTRITAAVFIALTVDTFRRISAQADAAGITEQVARGKQRWEATTAWAATPSASPATRSAAGAGR